MTKIRLAYVHEYRDRHGRLRRYVRRLGSRRVVLPGLPGSPEFMQAYQDAMTSPLVRPRAPKAGTLAALAAEFFGSAEFANLRPSSQATYRLALGPVLQLDGHRLVGSEGTTRSLLRPNTRSGRIIPGRMNSSPLTKSAGRLVRVSGLRSMFFSTPRNESAMSCGCSAQTSAMASSPWCSRRPVPRFLFHCILLLRARSRRGRPRAST